MLKKFQVLHHFCWAKKLAMELLAQSPGTPITQPRLQGGINAVANAVKVTLGPKGRNVVLQRESFQASDGETLGHVWDDDRGNNLDGLLDVWGSFKCLDKVFLGW